MTFYCHYSLLLICITMLLFVKFHIYVYINILNIYSYNPILPKVFGLE